MSDEILRKIIKNQKNEADNHCGWIKRLKDEIRQLETQIANKKEDIQNYELQNMHIAQTIEAINDILQKKEKEKHERLIRDSVEKETKIKHLSTKKIEETDGLIKIRKLCDYCDEWDGISSRCSCGNRRMCWELEDDGSDVFPNAY